MAPRLGSAVAVEVAEKQDVGEEARACCSHPVMNGGQLLPGEVSVGGGLEPAHAAHGVIGLPVAVSAQLPGSRTGPAGRIAEKGHGFRPGEAPALHCERLLPMLRAPVRSLVDELLVLTVRDLEPVQPEVSQLDGRQAPVFVDPSRDADHALRGLVLFIEREASDAHRPADVRRGLDGLEPLFLDSQAQVGERNAQRLQGGPAKRLPARVHVPVGLHQDLGARRIRLDREGERVVDEEALKGGIAGQVRLRPPREDEGVVVVLLLDQTGDLRERDVEGPARASPMHPPCGQTCHREHHDGRRDGSAPPAQGRFPSGYDGPGPILGERFFEHDSCVRDVSKAPFGILRQACLKQPPDAGRHRFGQRGPIRLVHEDGGDRVRRRIPAERRPACQHLVEHAAERPDVGARIHLEPTCLLRRHVGRGSDDRARPRLDHGLPRGPPARPLAVGGDAEVEDLHQPVRAYHDVLGFDVAVDDTGAVRGREGARDLHGDVERLGERERFAVHEEPQCRALDELRGHEAALVPRADLVDRDDVRVVEGGGGQSFLAEPAHALLAVRETSGQQLDGDAAVEALVVREEDLTHAAPADPVDHAVTADELAHRRPVAFGPVALDG